LPFRIVILFVEMFENKSKPFFSPNRVYSAATYVDVVPKTGLDIAILLKF